jgi:hypothetical protein
MEEHEHEAKMKKLSGGHILGIVAGVVVILFGIYWFGIKPHINNCSSTAFNETRADGAEGYTNAQILSSRNVVFDNYNRFYLACESGN